MPSNNFDDPILIDNGVGTPGSPGGYFGFGRAANAVISTGPRMYAGTGTPAGVLTAPIGSLYLQSDGAGSTYVNTNGGTAWAFSTVVAAAGLIWSDQHLGDPHIHRPRAGYHHGRRRRRKPRDHRGKRLQHRRKHRYYPG